MARTILALAVALIVSGCCSTRPGLSESEACKQNRDEAKRGWHNAHDPEWPARPSPEALLRGGMTVTEVREQLGAPAEVVRQEPAEDIDTWTYEDTEGVFEVYLRDGRVVGWKRGGRRNG